MRRQRTTVAQHAHLPRPTVVRSAAITIMAALCSVALAVAGVATYLVVNATSSVRANSVDLQLENPPAPAALTAYPGAFTMMVIGTDECDETVASVVGEERCFDPDSPGHLNDVNILIHVSEAPRRVTVMSFPRDLRVTIPGCTDDQGNVTEGTAKINSTYRAGGSNGLRCVADTLHEVTGLDIAFAAKLSFADVVSITDAVGGVTVCIGENGLHDSLTGLDLTAGEHEVKGGQALQFLRTRHGLNQGSDLARISNQQQYMSRLVQKLKSDDVLGNPVILLKLATIISEHMQTDTSLADPVRMAQLAFTLKDVPLTDMTFVSWPVLDTNDGSNDLVTIDSEAQTLLNAVTANQPLELAQTGAGTVLEEGTAEPVAPPVSAAPTEGAAEGASPSPSPSAVQSNASGQTAAQQTCSNGNG